jgi:hypothetical protein
VTVHGVFGAILRPAGAEEDAAWQRAEDLLADSLTPAQHASYRQKGYIDVPSTLIPGRTYRVDGWRPVAVHDRGRFVGAVCIRPREHLPAPDVLLARKLMIEGAEKQFLHAGNWLQPAWRPAGRAPTVFLLLALLGPWLWHLRTVHAWAFVGATALVGSTFAIGIRRRRSARRSVRT